MDGRDAVFEMRASKSGVSFVMRGLLGRHRVRKMKYTSGAWRIMSLHFIAWNWSKYFDEVLYCGVQVVLKSDLRD